MKYSILASLLACLSLVSCKPLTDVEQTSISFDRDASALNDGRISVHLSRVDDLVDENSHKLLLERMSHIALEIQLLPEQGALQVNGQQLSFMDTNESNVSSDEGDLSAMVSIVKADCYSIPSDLPPALYEPEAVESLVQLLSKGIVSLEIRLEKNEVPVGVALGASDEEVAAIQMLPGVSFRRISLYIKINEVEGVALEHSTLIEAPVLQLLVKSQEGAVTDVSTLSIAGLPVVPEIDAIEEPLLGAHEEPNFDDQEEAITPLFRPHHSHQSGILAWMQSLFGQSNNFHNHNYNKVHPRVRYGLAAADRVPDGPKFRKGHAFGENRRMRHHRLHQHCFARRFVLGVSYVFSTLAAFLTSTVAGVALLGFISGALLFSITRRIKKAAQRRRERRFAEEAGFFDDEKTIIVMEAEDEGLPEYEVHTTSPLFDAAQEEKAMSDKH